MRTRTSGRILAVQALYQLDVNDAAAEEAVEEFLSNSAKDEESRAYAEDIIHGCIEHREEVDAQIAAAAEHWDVARMAIVDRCILRVGAYELLHRSDVPPKVIINEAVRLAKKFSTAESGAFVNGLLDRIMSACRNNARTRQEEQ